MLLKTKSLLTAGLCLLLSGLGAQTILFTKGTHHYEPKSGYSYFTYEVKGMSYTTSNYEGGSSSFKISDAGDIITYMVGYDSLNPIKGKVYFNRPYFDSTRT